MKSRFTEEKLSEEDDKCLLKISETFKYKISSPYMERPLEIFRTKYEDFFSCVSRFHLPCVRSYYNGNNVYMLTSCMCALLTKVNCDYKYFAGVRDPICIINKYRQRGYGTIINDKEIIHMIYYNYTSSHWNQIFKINPKSKQSMLNHLGHVTLRNEIFKPNKYNNNFPDDIYNNNLNYKYVITEKDLIDEYIDLTEFPSNFDRTKKINIINICMGLKTINDKGTINTIQTSLIDTIYHLYES